MSDLISRQAAIERFCEFGTSLERQGKTMITMVDAKYAFIKILESLPSAERPTGEWARQESYDKGYEHGYDDGFYEGKKVMSRPTGKWEQVDLLADRLCSVCGYGVWDSEAEEYNYCPNCGAKMVREDGKEE